MNIAVISDSDTGTGFRLAGISAVYETKESDARNTFDKVLAENYDVIIITEKLVTLLEEKIQKIQEQVTPIVVEIPDKEGPTGYAKTSISETIRRAVGVDISKKEGN